MFDAQPDDWRMVRLGDVASINSENLGQRTDPASAFGYIDISQIEQPGLCTGWTPTTFAAAPSRARRKVREGDILVSTVRPYLRAFAKVPQSEGPLVASTGFAVVRANDQADQDFLFQHIMSDSFVEHLKPHMTGSSYPAVSSDDVSSYPLLLPPIDEQQRIADVLRSADQAISVGASALKQAHISSRATLSELLSNPDSDWVTARLGDVAEFVNGRGFKPHEWGESGLPIIRIQNLNGGTDFNRYSGDFHAKILVRPGDLLFAWSGSRGTSFGPHIWNGPDGLLNYHTWKVVPVRPEDRDFLFFALKDLTKKIEEEAHGASALVHMQKAFVVDYEIPFPPPHRRLEIGQMLTEIMNAAHAAELGHDNFVDLKQHLARDLLSGRVRVPV